MATGIDDPSVPIDEDQVPCYTLDPEYNLGLYFQLTSWCQTDSDPATPSSYCPESQSIPSDTFSSICDAGFRVNTAVEYHGADGPYVPCGTNSSLKYYTTTRKQQVYAWVHWGWDPPGYAMPVCGEGEYLHEGALEGVGWQITSPHDIANAVIGKGRKDKIGWLTNVYIKEYWEHEHVQIGSTNTSPCSAHYPNAIFERRLYYNWARLTCEDCLDQTYIAFPDEVEGYLYSTSYTDLDPYGEVILNDLLNTPYIDATLETSYSVCTTYNRVKYLEVPTNIIPDYCFIIDGNDSNIDSTIIPNLIYKNEIFKYIIYTDFEVDNITGKRIYVEEDEIIYLSYNGSTITNGIEFEAPTSVTISAGSSSVEFSIKIFNYESDTNDFINISGTSFGHISCNQFINEILNESTYDPDLCSDMFFWQEPTCDNFFRPEEYTKFEIKRKGG